MYVCTSLQFLDDDGWNETGPPSNHSSSEASKPALIATFVQDLRSIISRIRLFIRLFRRRVVACRTGTGGFAIAIGVWARLGSIFSFFLSFLGGLTVGWEDKVGSVLLRKGKEGKGRER